MRASVVFVTLSAIYAQPPGDPGLAALLKKAAQSAERFSEEFPSMTCTEKVVQFKVGERGKVTVRREEVYDYLILLNLGDGGFTFEESRIRREGPGKPPQQPLLTTTGFAVMAVLFHPQFLESYQISRLEPEGRGGRMWARVRFEHITGRPSPSVLEVSGRQYPLEWRGVAWLDPATGAVGRVEAEIKSSLEDIGLMSLRSEVEYLREGEGLWMPHSAVIEARTRRQHWKNMHEFTAYRRFEVSTQQKVEEVRR